MADTRTFASIAREQVTRDLAKMEANGVPANIAESLRMYVLDGIKPGSFTSACLANDLLDAACHAGAGITLGGLTAIVKTFYNDFPPLAWGSKDKVDAWVAQGGVGGRT